jgi:hypothetical protein
MRASRQSARTGEGLPRRLAVALTALLTTFALVSGFVHANGRYFYCEAMGLMATDPCASAAPRDERNARPPTEARRGHGDCCEVVSLPSLPQGTTSASSAVPLPALVAAMPPAPLPVVQAGAPRAPLDRAVLRLRAPPRSAAQARAQLMVFLT